jgi:hypothetical protein
VITKQKLRAAGAVDVDLAGCLMELLLLTVASIFGIIPARRVM